MTSADILVRISSLKDEIDSRAKEIKTLEEELKEINRKEARRIMLERRERTNRMATFIRANEDRTLIAEITWPVMEGDEYLGETIRRHTLKKGEYKLYLANNDWCISNEEFACLLECVDNIYVAFE